MNLIDRNKVIDKLNILRKLCPDLRTSKMKRDLLHDIEQLPTIEAEPVRRGEWKHVVRNKFECTACERESHVETVMGEPTYERCPHCGAKMDGKKAEKKE